MISLRMVIPVDMFQGFHQRVISWMSCSQELIHIEKHHRIRRAPYFQTEPNLTRMSHPSYLQFEVTTVMKRSLILDGFASTCGKAVAKNTKHLRQHGCVTCHFWSPSIFHIQTSYWWVYIYIYMGIYIYIPGWWFGTWLLFFPSYWEWIIIPPPTDPHGITLIPLKHHVSWWNPHTAVEEMASNNNKRGWVPLCFYACRFKRLIVPL